MAHGPGARATKLTFCGESVAPFSTPPVLSGSENTGRHKGRYQPIGGVDYLADLQIGGNAAEHVGVLAGEIVCAL